EGEGQQAKHRWAPDDRKTLHRDPGEIDLSGRGEEIRRVAPDHQLAEQPRGGRLHAAVERQRPADDRESQAALPLARAMVSSTRGKRRRRAAAKLYRSTARSRARCPRAREASG